MAVNQDLKALVAIGLDSCNCLGNHLIEVGVCFAEILGVNGALRLVHYSLCKQPFLTNLRTIFEMAELGMLAEQSTAAS